jgi:hypothetical protein
MRNFTRLLLVLAVSVFFINQSVLGQAMHTKATDGVRVSTPYVQPAKSAGDILMADSYSIDFEDEVDFTFDFTPWTVVDVDLLPTYGMTGVTWPNAYDPQAFIVFNPATTDPPMTDDPEIQPYSGEKFGACLSSVPSGGQGNDDWFISDHVSVGDGASFTFWAKSYTDEYGLERFNVAVSTTTPDPGEFTVISGPTYIEAPIVWTEYSYDLSDYAGQDIYVAIQCVSYDAFVFMIDDLVIDPGTVAGPCQNFDDLAVGDYVAVELDDWTTWSNNPGSAEDGLITDVVSYSPDNSFVVDGSVDLVQWLNDENLTSGMYYYSNMMYVPDGYCGYFNLQKDIVPGVEWGFQVQFDADGMANVDAGAAAAATFAFTFDEWHMNELIVDLDGDYAEYWFDGVLVVSWPWSTGTFGTPGALTLGSANYYAWSSGGNDPLCYFDDVCFEEIFEDFCEDFDDLSVGDYVAVELDDWTTWSNNPGSAEDALITDVVSLSPDNSFEVTGSTDLIRLFADENLEGGKYYFSLNMNVADGYCGYFNLQKDVVPGVEWGFQVQFDVDGTATVDAGAAAAATFPFDHDTWILNELIVDIDEDWAEYWVDGVMIIEWQWTLGTFGTAGANTLGGANIYAWASAGNSPLAYFDDVCFEVLEPVGIGDIPVDMSAVSAVIYPNPARDRITIKSDEIIDEVRIFNNMGQLVYSGQHNNEQVMINTSNYINGMYLVQVISGNAVEVRKLIIE